MKERTVFALDLGTSKVACLAAGGREEGQLDIRGGAAIACQGLYRGVIVDVAETASAIDTAVRKTAQMTGVEPEELVVSISGAHLETQIGQGLVPIFPRTRAIGREDVLQVIKHSRQTMPPAGREIIQAIPREFRVDGQSGVHRPIGMHGDNLEVMTHIVTGLAEHVRNVEEAVTTAGHKVGQMVAAPVASGLAVATQANVEQGCCVLDIGAGVTDMAVFIDGAIAYSVSYPIAGNLVTSDLQKLLKTTFEEAERLKLESGTAWADGIDDDESVDVLQVGQTTARPLQRKVLSEIIESRMREIATIAQRLIVEGGYEGALNEGVLITGGGSLLPATTTLFDSVFGPMKSRQVRPLVGGAFADLASSPAMATAAGLARYALQDDDEEIAPAVSSGSWKERIRTLFSGKA